MPSTTLVPSPKMYFVDLRDVSNIQFSPLQTTGGQRLVFVHNRKYIAVKRINNPSVPMSVWDLVACLFHAVLFLLVSIHISIHSDFIVPSDLSKCELPTNSTF